MLSFTHLFAIGVLVLVVIYLSCLPLDLAVITLMSGHSLGQQTSQKRLRQLTSQFILGVGIMLWLLISSICLVLYFNFNHWLNQPLGWLAIVILLAIQILFLLITRLRQPDLPHAWLPQDMRHFLTKRATKTKSPAEAFSLGLTSLFVELPIAAIPLIVAGLALLLLPSYWLVFATVAFSVLTILPLVFARLSLINRRPTSILQRHLAQNRTFFHYFSLASLLVLILFINCFLISGF